MTLNLKQHDRRPWLVAQLQHDDGSGIDVSLAISIDVIVRVQGGTAPLFRAECEILTTQPPIPATYDDNTAVSDLDGWVRYKWEVGDTDASGVYDVEWEILWAADEPQTVPTVGYYSVSIADDLDAA